MSEKLGKEDIAGYECRHVVYQRPPTPDAPDMHVVKEIIHTRDGRHIPHVRMWKDFKREFHVTKDADRKHKQKKEWEDIRKLRTFQTRQCDLIRSAAKALGQPYFHGGLRKLAQSPYLYGADIKSTAILKHNYQAKYPELTTPYVAAPFDIESDVVHGTGEPIIIAFAYQNHVYTVVDKKFVEGYTNVEERLRVLLTDKLGDLVAERKIEWHLEFVDGTIACIKQTFKHIHERKPDFLSIWNMDFDIPRVAETLEKYGESPAEVFSDPGIPSEYKDFFYKRGPSQKVTAAGKVMPIKPAGRWHTVFTPASYYVIDAMCAYRHIRNQQAEEQSYSLDAILNKEIERGKLKFTGITSVTEGTLEWHQEMQSKHPLEYIVYNFFDVVGMQVLDDKIQDLALTLPMFSGCSDFQDFKSQPRRMVDDLHYFCLDNKTEATPEGQVIATTSDTMRDQYDDLTVDTDGWIITLPAHLVVDNGLQIIEHAPWLRTNFRGHTGDLDVSASYPTNEEVMNISKETTHRELVKIEGIDLYEQKMCGINLSGGPTNAVEIATVLFKLPTLDELLNDFRDHIANQ